MIKHIPWFGKVSTRRHKGSGGKPRRSHHRTILAPELLEDRVTPSGTPLSEVRIGLTAAGVTWLDAQAPGAAGAGAESVLEFRAAMPGLLTLRRDGPDLQVVDTQTEEELARRPLAGASEVIVHGVALADDTLTIDLHSGSIPVPITFHGGAAGFDSLIVDGGQFARSTYLASGPDSGTITLDDTVIRYTGLEPITDTTTVNDRVFDDTTTGNQKIRLIDDGNPANGFVTIDSDGTGGFESLTFRNPANTLTINAGDGDDTILVGALDQGFGAAVTIRGGAGDDDVLVQANAAFAGTFDGGAGSDAIVNQGSTSPGPLVSVEQVIRLTSPTIVVDLTGPVSLTGVRLSLGGLEVAGDFTFAVSDNLTTLTFANARVDLAGAQGPVVSLTDINGTFTIVEDDPATSTTGGVYGAATGTAILNLPDVLLEDGELALQLNTTAAAQLVDLDGNGTMGPDEELEAGLVAVAGTGVTLTVLGQELTRDFSFSKTPTAVNVAFARVALNLGDIVGLSNVQGDFTALAGGGLYGAASGTPTLTLPDVSLTASSLALRINTTDVDQAIGSLSLPANSVEVTGTDVALTIGPASNRLTLSGGAISLTRTPAKVTAQFTGVMLDLAGIITIDGIDGDITALAGGGLYGIISTTAAPTLDLPGVSLSADSLSLRINTTSMPRTVGDDSVPADSVAVAGGGVTLTLLDTVTLMGDLSFALSDTSVMLSCSGVSFDVGGILTLPNLSGSFEVSIGGLIDAITVDLDLDLDVPGFSLQAGSLVLGVNTSGEEPTVNGVTLRADELVSVTVTGVVLTLLETVALSGTFTLAATAGGGGRVRFEDAAFNIAGLLAVTDVDGSFTSASGPFSGIYGGARGTVVLDVPGVTCTAQELELRINTTLTPQDFGAETLDANLLAVSGTGLELKILETVDLKGNFSFSRSVKADLSVEVKVEFTQVQLNLGGVLSLTDVNGNFTATAGLSTGGLYGDASGSVALALPGFTFSVEKWILRFNTTNGNLDFDVDLDGVLEPGEMLAAQSLEVAAEEAKLTTFGIEASGDRFAFKQAGTDVNVAFVDVDINVRIGTKSIFSVMDVQGDLTLTTAGLYGFIEGSVLSSQGSGFVLNAETVRFEVNTTTSPHVGLGSQMDVDLPVGRFARVLIEGTLGLQVAVGTGTGFLLDGRFLVAVDETSLLVTARGRNDEPDATFRATIADATILELIGHGALLIKEDGIAAKIDLTFDSNPGGAGFPFDGRFTFEVNTTTATVATIDDQIVSLPAGPYTRLQITGKTAGEDARLQLSVGGVESYKLTGTFTIVASSAGLEVAADAKTELLEAVVDVDGALLITPGGIAAQINVAGALPTPPGIVFEGSSTLKINTTDDRITMIAGKVVSLEPGPSASVAIAGTLEILELVTITGTFAVETTGGTSTIDVTGQVDLFGLDFDIESRIIAGAAGVVFHAKVTLSRGGDKFEPIPGLSLIGAVFLDANTTSQANTEFDIPANTVRFAIPEATLSVLGLRAKGGIIIVVSPSGFNIDVDVELKVGPIKAALRGSVNSNGTFDPTFRTSRPCFL